MSKMWVVFRQEYLNRVRTRGFVLGTVLLPLFIILIMVLPAVLMTMDVEQPGRYLVVDSTGVLFEPLAAALSDSNEAGQRLFQLEKAALEPGSADPIADLNAEVVADRIAGYFVLGKGLLDSEGGEPV